MKLGMTRHGFECGKFGKLRNIISVCKGAEISRQFDVETEEKFIDIGKCDRRMSADIQRSIGWRGVRSKFDSN